MSNGSGTYKGTTPTRPSQKAVRVPEPGDDEGEPTQQRCPCCLGHGYVNPDVAIAFESFCSTLHAEQK